MSWQQLANRFPWPAQRPKIEPFVHGWKYERPLLELVKCLPENAAMVEVGAWTGKTSTWLLSEFGTLRLVAVDLWSRTPPRLDAYWGQWLKEKRVGSEHEPIDLYRANTWNDRHRVLCVQATSVAGMLAVAGSGVRPRLVYIDADHGEAAVIRDVSVALELWGNGETIVCGHDYANDDGSTDGPVARAVRRCAGERSVLNVGKVWWYE